MRDIRDDCFRLGLADQPAPLISVIVPHFNDVQRLARCVQALNAQSVQRDSFEIIVADNGSPCGIEAVGRAAFGARVISVREKGAGPARNGALGLARGCLLAFTDSDCVPDPNWLAEGRTALETSDIVGGHVGVTVSDPRSPTPVEAFEMIFAFDNKRYVERLGFSVTANLFARRAVYDSIGGFKVGIPEDLDWCRRARQAGFRLSYAHRAFVNHPARHDMQELISKWHRLTAESFGDVRMNGGNIGMWIAKSAAVFASPLRDATRVMTTRRVKGVAPRLSATAVLFRIRALRALWMLRLRRQSSVMQYDKSVTWMDARTF